MGLYLRKSVSVGPFRFNLSGTGVGVSVGVKGFRVGSGPRGNYVRIGGGGIQYRAAIPVAVRPANRQPVGRPSVPGHRIEPDVASVSHGPMIDIDSAQATTIVDSSSKALLDELNAKQRRRRRWPWVAAVGGVAFWGCLTNGVFDWRLIALAVFVFLASGFMYVQDMVKKSVVLLYELDPGVEEALEHLHASANALMAVGAIWHVSSRAQVYDSKYHAGAQSVVSRAATKFLLAPPPYVKTNIRTVAVDVGTQTLHFFPDRVLIYDKNGVGAVSYPGLRVDAGPTSFVEEEVVPRDATVVGSTWRYVNKKGGPDRRFKDNREIPICRYDRLAFRSDTGMNELLHVSRSGVGVAFAEALHRLARIMPAERHG